jgi:hypothetical protein
MNPQFLVFALMLVLAGCASQSAEVNSRADAANLVELKLFVVFGGEHRYTADGTHVTKEALAWSDIMDRASPHVAIKTEVAPDKKAWDAFWETVSQLKLEAWRQKYSTDDLTVKTEGGGFFSVSMVRVMDGMSWSVKMVRQKQPFLAEGTNAYPTIGDPNQTTLDKAAVDTLAVAFYNLLTSAPAK